MPHSVPSSSSESMAVLACGKNSSRLWTLMRSQKQVACLFVDGHCDRRIPIACLALSQRQIDIPVPLQTFWRFLDDRKILIIEELALSQARQLLEQCLEVIIQHIGTRVCNLPCIRTFRP